MQLLILILKKVELMDEIIKQVAESGVRGGTIIDGTGMAKSLLSMEDLPVLGMLKLLLADDVRDACKVMMFVLKEEQVIITRKIIKQIMGNLNAPNTGIIFAIPITYVEGLGE